jgi:hypothetical protein
VRTTIHQPRLDSISTEVLSVTELCSWAEEVKKTAALAYKGKGEYKSGSHCKFCRAKGNCTARADEQIGRAMEDFTGLSPEESLLAPERIGGILHAAKEYADWYADICAWALVQARDHGASFPGWKLVEGRSIRKYTDEKQIVKTLKELGFAPSKYQTKKLKGITELQKTIGKDYMKDLMPYITKPPGKPVLVPDTDKRPALNAAADDFKE